MPRQTTFRSRLFRILIGIGIGAACLVASALCAIDITATRQYLVKNLQQETLVAENAAAMDMQRHENWRITELFPVFSLMQGFDMVCFYTKENHLTQHWQADAYTGHCPSYVQESGLSETLFSAHFAIPIKAEENYLGMVYAETLLSSRATLLERAAAVFVTLLLMASFTCAVAAHYGARHIVSLMEAIRQQIDCLKGNTSECILPPAAATVETSDLYDAIQNLRIHLVTLLVPRESILHLREWYENIFFNLFSLLRHRIAADSTLIPLLRDCELLLRLNNSAEAEAPHETVDIHLLVDEGLASARLLSPPSNLVHMVASFKSSSAKDWKVQSTYLSALIRHLLLIGLARTRLGLIFLRMEIVLRPEKMNQPVLVWRMEDNGPPIQPGTLHSRLTDKEYKIVSVSEASWLLIVQLTKQLKGSLRGANTPTGLLLEGEIPVAYAEPKKLAILAPVPEMLLRPDEARLVLMIGNPSPDFQALCRVFEKQHCQVVCVANHILALEIVSSMPFSAIVMDTSLSHRDIHTALRRFVALMENKSIPVMPLYIITGTEVSAEHEQWKNAGANQILLAPVHEEKVMYLCNSLRQFDQAFWSAHDAKLMEELPGTVLVRLSDMRTELMGQIRKVETAIAVASKKPYVTEVLHQVHAVKSASLALGYMRLAALMANLEHMLAGKQTTLVTKNIVVISYCLKAIRLE